MFSLCVRGTVSPDRPNVVIVTTEDQSNPGVSSHENPVLKTPEPPVQETTDFKNLVQNTMSNKELNSESSPISSQQKKRTSLDIRESLANWNL